jgi:cell division transport system permease protein
MTVTLGIIGALMFLSALLTFTLDSIREKVNISVYFVTSAAESEVLALKNKIEQLPQVSTVSYLSREDALLAFRERHAHDQLTLQALDELGENPLSASLEISAKDPAQYESIAATLATIPALSSSGASIVDRINYAQNKEVIERLNRAITATQDLGLVVVLVFALASVLIAFSTIRLAIFTSKDEIGVMRLVGASNTYIRGPFVVAGVLTGLLATAIVLLLMWPVSWYLGGNTAGWLGGFNFFTYYIQNFLFIGGVLLGSGVVLGGLASLLAIRRYLKI